MDSIFIERSKIIMDNACPVYVNQEGRWNIPVNNLQVVILGRGTSITHDAAESLSLAGVPFVFTGAQGMPYICAPVTGYHPTDIQRGWIGRWMCDEGRLNMAKEIFQHRIEYGLRHADVEIVSQDQQYVWARKGATAEHLDQLLGIEGDRLHWLYQQYATHHAIKEFSRLHEATDPDAADPRLRINAYLSHGNALAYGIAAAAMWHLGLSAAYPLVHGLTRNGGLIFDAADLIKDTTVLPWAFDCYRMPTTRAMHELRYRIKHQRGDVFIMDTLSRLAREVSE
jgi:CRISPR-associated protein Cas1